MSLGYILYNNERKRQTVRQRYKHRHTQTQVRIQREHFATWAIHIRSRKPQFRTPSMAILVSAKAIQSSVRYAVNHHTKQQSPGNDCVTQFLTVLVSESCTKHGVQLLTRENVCF